MAAIDETQVFLVYMALVGDAEKTALALDLDVSEVTRLAVRGQWYDKVRRISLQSKSGTPGDWERAQNRALNFVQCHQLRRRIDAALAHMAGLSAEQLITFTDHNGVTKLSAKLFQDIATSMKLIHEMTYAALGDTVKEREQRDEGKDPTSTNAAGLHQALINTLNTSSLTDKPAEELVAHAAQVVEGLKSAK